MLQRPPLTASVLLVVLGGGDEPLRPARQARVIDRRRGRGRERQQREDLLRPQTQGVRGARRAVQRAREPRAGFDWPSPVDVQVNGEEEAAGIHDTQGKDTNDWVSAGGYTRPFAVTQPADLPHRSQAPWSPHRVLVKLGQRHHCAHPSTVTACHRSAASVTSWTARTRTTAWCSATAHASGPSTRYHLPPTVTLQPTSVSSSLDTCRLVCLLLLARTVVPGPDDRGPRGARQLPVRPVHGEGAPGEHSKEEDLPLHPPLHTHDLN